MSLALLREMVKAVGMFSSPKSIALFDIVRAPIFLTKIKSSTNQQHRWGNRHLVSRFSTICASDSCHFLTYCENWSLHVLAFVSIEQSEEPFAFDGTFISSRWQLAFDIGLTYGTFCTVNIGDAVLRAVIKWLSHSCRTNHVASPFIVVSSDNICTVLLIWSLMKTAHQDIAQGIFQKKPVKIRIQQSSSRTQVTRCLFRC